MSTPTGPFLMLSGLYGDEAMADAFSEERTVSGWLEAEAAFACGNLRSVRARAR